MSEFANNYWGNPDPTLTFEDKRLAGLLEYWENKRGRRSMPSRADVDPNELVEHLGTLCLIDVEHDPFRLRYRLVGSKITEFLGRDVTGQYFDDLYSKHALRDATDLFRWVVENKAPIRSIGEGFDKHKDRHVGEILNLPLSDDGETVNMVLGAISYRRAPKRE